MKRLLLATVLAVAAFAALPTFDAFARDGGAPPEVFVPRGAQLVKMRREGGGKFAAKYILPKGDVHALAQQARKHAERQGWRVVKNKDKGYEVELELARGKAEMDISVEHAWEGVKYEVEIERR